jgi:hypothetical protein
LENLTFANMFHGLLGNSASDVGLNRHKEHPAYKLEDRLSKFK